MCCISILYKSNLSKIIGDISMKDKVIRLIKYIWVYTILYELFYFFVTVILDKLGYVFADKTIQLHHCILCLGIVLSCIQIIWKLIANKFIKIIVCIAIVFSELWIVTKVCNFNNAVEDLVNDRYEIVYVDGRKMIKVTHSALLSNSITYYDYINEWIEKKYERIYIQYDDTLSDEDYLYTIYYDDNGNKIKEETRDNRTKIVEEKVE